MPQQKINLIGEKFFLWIWVFGIFKDLCDFFAVTMSILSILRKEYSHALSGLRFALRVILFESRLSNQKDVGFLRRHGVCKGLSNSELDAVIKTCGN